MSGSSSRPSQRSAETGRHAPPAPAPKAGCMSEQACDASLGKPTSQVDRGSLGTTAPDASLPGREMLRAPQNRGGT